MALTKPQVRRLIKDSLTTKYNEARDSRIAHTISLKLEIDNTLALYREEKDLRGIYNPITDKEQELYNDVFGIHNKVKCCREGGLLKALTNKEYKLIRDKAMTERDIKHFFTVEFKEALKTLIEKIYSDIKLLSPKTIQSIETSDYDIELLLALKDGARSYTVNTVIAGGYNIQCLHYRTSYKLHKGVL